MMCCRSGLLLEESNCFIPVPILCSKNASVRHKRVIVSLFWLRKPQTSSLLSEEVNERFDIELIIAVDILWIFDFPLT